MYADDIAVCCYVDTANVDVVIKAQALTGGRGLGSFKNGFKGGVHMCTKYVFIFIVLLFAILP